MLRVDGLRLHAEAVPERGVWEMNEWKQPMCPYHPGEPLVPYNTRDGDVDDYCPICVHGDDEDDEDGDCFWCHGEGWRECDDPIQCTSPHNKYGECQCGSCGGSGRAADMTIW
jgi:hypothetical protein